MSFRRGRGNFRRGGRRGGLQNSSKDYGDNESYEFHEKPDGESRNSWHANYDAFSDYTRNCTRGPIVPPMDEESEMYFQIVHERMMEPFENDEEKDLFLVNVVEQMSGKENLLAVRSLGSRTFQRLLDLNSSPDLVVKLIVPLQPDIKILCSNQYGSLVIECLLLKSLKFIASGDAHECFTVFVLSVAECIAETFPEALDCPFQNYVVKTLTHVLAGNILYSNNEKKIQPMFRKVQFADVPESFIRMLFKLTKQALSVEDLEQWFTCDRFSLALQHILVVSAHFPDLRQEIVEKILEIVHVQDVPEGKLHPLLVNPISSYLVQSIAEVFNRKQRRKFMKKFVNKNLTMLLEDKYANYIVKALIKATAKKENFVKFYDKLEPNFSQMFNCKHTINLVAVADCCLRFDVCQARFVIAMKTILQCNEKQDYFVPCLLHMLTYDQYVLAEAENTATTSLNGSLLLQRILNFSKPIKIVMAIVDLDFDLLKRILCDSKGCHLVDSFMTSKTVGEKSRDKFVSKVRDIAIMLACCAPGSRCIDAIWQNASLKQKLTLADALAKNAEVLQTNNFGRYIHKNLALGHFKNRLDDWKQVQATQDKKHKLFQDILGDSENVQRKKLKQV